MEDLSDPYRVIIGISLIVQFSLINLSLISRSKRNPLSNFFIRFFLAAAIFSVFFEKTKKCFIDFKKIK